MLTIGTPAAAFGQGAPAPGAVTAASESGPKYTGPQNIASGHQAAATTEICPSAHNPPAILTGAKTAFAGGAEMVIVALGSSSTQGWMATTNSATYPAQLQDDLQKAFPSAHFAVLNRGIGGQDAAEEVLRLDADAMAPKPAIVIWQVGANYAMRNSDPAVFRKLVSAGIERLQGAGVDVILMDNQRSPMIMAAPEHAIIDQTLEDIAKQYHITLFSRGALMDAWQRDGAPYDKFVSPDQLHHNDFGYRCLAQALSYSIATGLTAPTDATLTTVKR